MDLTGEEHITLDRDTFRALASETRVSILKRLDVGQRTVSDLARDMSMNKATMFQHLETLIEVGLVKKASPEERAKTIKPLPNQPELMGPPRKWVTYRLTWKGKNVLHPERVKIALLLSTFAIAFLGVLIVFGLSNIMPGLGGPGGGEDLRALDKVPPDVRGLALADIDGQSTEVRYELQVIDVTADGQVPVGTPPRGVTGIDEATITVHYSLYDATDQVTPLKGPVDISGQATKVRLADRPGFSVQGVVQDDFAKYAGGYLYLEVTAKDEATNLVSEGRFRYIEPLGGPDLRFRARTGGAAAPVSFDEDASGVWSVTVRYENVGIEPSDDFLVSFYLADPDPDNDGVLEASAVRLHAVAVDGLLPATMGNETVLWEDLLDKVGANQATYRGSPVPTTLFVTLDGGGIIVERNETNNKGSAVIPPGAGSPAADLDTMKLFSGTGNPPPSGVPEEPRSQPSMAPGFEAVGLLAAVGVAVAILRRRKGEAA